MTFSVYQRQARSRLNEGMLVQHAYALIFLLLLMIQLALLAYTFPLSAIFSGQPLLYYDHPMHLYQIAVGRSLLKQVLLVGYDPFFGAGYVGGVTYNMSARLPVLVSIMLPDSLRLEKLYSVYVFLCALFVPGAIVGTALILRWTAMETLSTGIIGLLFWWISGFRWNYASGGVGFACACYWAIFYTAYVWTRCAWTTRRAIAGSLAAGVAGGIGLWLHPLFWLPVVFLFLSMLLLWKPEVSLRELVIRGLLVTVIAVLIASPWVVAMAGAHNQLSDQLVDQTAHGLNVLLRFVAGLPTDVSQSRLYPLCFVLGIVAIATTRGGLRRRIAAFVLAGSALVIFAAFAASLSALRPLQPNRFVMPGFLMMGLGVSLYLPTLWATIRSASQQLRCVAMIALCVVAGYFMREVIREVSRGGHAHYAKTSPPEIKPVADSLRWMEEWIRKNTTPEGRVLVELSNGRIHGSAYAHGYLALRTGREFVGAAYPGLLRKSSVQDGIVFGHKAGTLTAERFLRYLDIYNVGWVVAHSPELITLLEQSPTARADGHFGPIRAFSIERPLSFFETGTGNVLGRDVNRVEFDNVEGQTVRLRFHWVDGLSSTPPTDIQPVTLDPGLPPFVGVIDPPRHFVLHR